MPVYNTNQHFLKEAILSILKSQTYKGTTYLIIVDDGSTDPKTVKMLDSCKQSNENVILHRLKTNEGLPQALNIGIKIAMDKGVDYIARMDSDDLSVPERIETQVNFMIENPQVDIVGSSVLLF
jgi:glycosyltransferase involved in cell wall biosynthesis